MHLEWYLPHHNSALKTGTCSVVIVELARTIPADFWQAIADVHLFFLRFTSGIKIRALGLTCDTHCVSAMWAKAVGCRVVLFGLKLLCASGSGGITHADTVVPEGNVILLPLEPNLDLLSRSDKLVQITDDRSSLCLRNANYIRDESCKWLAVSKSCDRRG